MELYNSHIIEDVNYQTAYVGLQNNWLVIGMWSIIAPTKH